MHAADKYSDTHAVPRYRITTTRKELSVAQVNKIREVIRNLGIDRLRRGFI